MFSGKGGTKAQSGKGNESLATLPHPCGYTPPDQVTVRARRAYLGHKNGLGHVLLMFLHIFASWQVHCARQHRL